MPLRKSIDSTIVKSFWEHMCKAFNARYSDKQSSRLMRAIGWLLQLVHIMSAKTFLTQYVTTIGKTIYLPFKLGDAANTYWSLWDQMMVCGHELVHVVQHYDAPTIYELGYVCSSRLRFLYESEAYERTIELYYWRFNQYLDTAKLQKALNTYGWHTKADELFSKHELDEEIVILKAYGIASITNEVSAKAIHWLDYMMGAHYEGKR
jgi:hypothetical protein